MKMIQFKDELVALKQCRIGAVVGIDLECTRVYYGHIVGFSEDHCGNILFNVQSQDENTIVWFPEDLIWNV